MLPWIFAAFCQTPKLPSVLLRVHCSPKRDKLRPTVSVLCAEYSNGKV